MALSRIGAAETVADWALRHGASALYNVPEDEFGKY
jgi:hypothetical protein